MALYHGIRNAQDATRPDGEVSVELEPNGANCTIRIIDNGTGMVELIVRERFFKPFDGTKGMQGMGIGAYQIREAVRSADGEIQVSSEPGRGTAFCIILPIKSPG